MWLGKQGRLRRESGGAELGVTSIAGAEAAVVTGGESRRLPVYGPGGFCWVPEAGQRVLVIRGGPGGEEQCDSFLQNVLSQGEVSGIKIFPSWHFFAFFIRQNEIQGANPAGGTYGKK